MVCSIIIYWPRLAGCFAWRLGQPATRAASEIVCRGARLRVESSGFGIQGERTSRFGGFRDTRTTHRAWYIL